MQTFQKFTFGTIAASLLIASSVMSFADDPPSRVAAPRDGQAPERSRTRVSLVECGGAAVTEPQHRVDDEVVHPVQVEGSDQLTSHLGEGVRGLFGPRAR